MATSWNNRLLPTRMAGESINNPVTISGSKPMIDGSIWGAEVAGLSPVSPASRCGLLDVVWKSVTLEDAWGKQSNIMTMGKQPLTAVNSAAIWRRMVQVGYVNVTSSILVSCYNDRPLGFNNYIGLCLLLRAHPLIRMLPVLKLYGLYGFPNTIMNEVWRWC